MSAALRLEPGTIFAGDFRIIRPLAEGGMGSVYVATQLSTHAERALKVMLPGLVSDERLRARFLQEARMSSRIESDHVVQVVGSGVDAVSGIPWLAMELLKGEDLATFMHRSGAQSIMFVRELLAQLCHAVAAAHDVQVVHRDLKPENILLAAARREGVPFTVKVLDFGIAKMTADVKTQHAGMIGSPMWMAPEQTESTTNVTAAADIWPLGLIAFYALTGQMFWRGAYKDASVVSLIREVAIEPIPAATARAAELGAAHLLPPGFDAWFARCLARDPAHRFYSAREARSAFDKLQPTNVRSPSGPPMPRIASTLPASPTVAAAPIAAQPWQQHRGTEIGTPAPLPVPRGSRTPRGTTNPLPWIIGGVVAFIFIFVAAIAGVGFIVAKKKKPIPEAVVDEDDDVVHKKADAEAFVPVLETDPTWGETLAPVTIVMFADLECPYCKRVEDNALTVVRTTYRGKVRIVWKDNPIPALHPHARDAAIAANSVFREKGNEAFWRFQKNAFDNQENLDGIHFDEWAKEVGATLVAKNALKVDADTALAKKLGVKGTPSFRVNGLVIEGAQPFEVFKTVIDEQVIAADIKRGNGTTRARLYNEMCRDNSDKKPVKTEATEDDTTIWRVPVGTSPVLGLNDAPVTIVEFGDFECPFCKRTEPTLEKLREHYGDKLRLVWKNHPLPFHTHALPAALFALQARKEKGDKIFWATHDRLYNAARFDESDFEGIAADLGVSKNRSKDKTWQKDIDADEALADDVEATGTPTFFVNGRKLGGAQPYERFAKIVDEELAKARTASVTGVGYYDSIIRDGKMKPLETKSVADPAFDAPFRGSAYARVVVQVFSEFQCSYCARVDPTLDEVLKSYGDKVKIVWRDMPITGHVDAPLAAEAAREAKRQKGNPGFWAMHKKLFANQAKLKRDDLRGYARELGLDLNKFDAALDDHDHKLAVDADARAAQIAGIGGAPAFVINGYFISGAQPVAKFRKVIDRALAE